MTDQLEQQAWVPAAALIAGDFRAVDLALDGLREVTWHRRAAEIRARRHAGPGPRRASFGRAVLRRKPRSHNIPAGEASDLIAAGRRGA